MLKKAIAYSILGSLLISGLITSGQSLAASFSTFGPKVHHRINGQPITDVDTFVSYSEGTYTLQIFDGGLEDDTYSLVSSSVVYINGIQVVAPNELNQNTSYIEKNIELININEISVQLRGKPGGALIINIVGNDAVPPDIIAQISPTANNQGWHTEDVTISFTCSDIGSGVVSCPAPVVVSDEGAGQAITATAIDAAGNSTDTTVTINLDKTLPNLSLLSPTKV
jgi:hypothetical protein